MARWRVALAFAIIGSMVVALALVVLRDNGDAEAAPTTSPIPTPTTTSTSTPTAPTTTLDQGARIREVEAILEDLETRRFQAIYDQDLEALAEVAEGQMYEGAVLSIEQEFFRDYYESPAAVGVKVDVLEIMTDRPDCLVVYNELDVSAFRDDSEFNPFVSILWPSSSGEWQLVKTWQSRTDYEELVDCDLAIRDGR